MKSSVINERWKMDASEIGEIADRVARTLIAMRACKSKRINIDTVQVECAKEIESITTTANERLQLLDLANRKFLELCE